MIGAESKSADEAGTLTDARILKLTRIGIAAF